MRAPVLPLLVCTLAACRAPGPTTVRGVAGDPLAEGRSSLVTTGSWTTTVPGDPRGIEMLSTRLDYGQFVRQGLSLGGELGLHAINGGSTSAGDSGNTSGLSASAMLRWRALQGRGWSAFLEFGLGVLGTDDAFPAGGSHWNGVRQTGAGLEVGLTSQLRLTAGVRQQHVSNGKGLVDDNPSWEGQGAYLGLAFDVTPRGAQQLPSRAMTVPEASRWSARLEGRVGEFGDDDGGGGVAVLDSQLEGPWFGQLRISGDRLSGEALTEFGGALYFRAERGRYGVAYDHQELDVFSDDELSLFGEHLANDITTVTSVIGAELRSQADDRVFAGVLLRIYAFEDLARSIPASSRAPPGTSSAPTRSTCRSASSTCSRSDCSQASRSSRRRISTTTRA